MKPDFSGFVDDGMITLDNVTDCVGGEGLGEGAQVMKRNGWYCIVNICWPAGSCRSVVVHRARSMQGPWEGRGEVSRQYHRWARNHLMPHGLDLHPVLLNSWEGSYFSFTEKTLTDMMDGVKEMGGEMFVLDDGWFGRSKYARDEKNQDKVGLGDWFVNEEKLPRGLGYLADEAAKRGLKFGLWIEPEMVNTRSWLAEEHPEWILREEARRLALGRGGTQVVLDYTNPAVRDGAKYDISEINGAPSHGARLDGRNLKLALSGSYDSAVFELKTCE